ncbi:MAG: hypothetical protein J0L93_09885 [Deltaproteobacteria bacterium]|nr:hypothetical protein [Deltaproteobacteria bacterium]
MKFLSSLGASALSIGLLSLTGCASEGSGTSPATTMSAQTSRINLGNTQIQQYEAAARADYNNRLNNLNNTMAANANSVPVAPLPAVAPTSTAQKLGTGTVIITAASIGGLLLASTFGKDLIDGGKDVLKDIKTDSAKADSVPTSETKPDEIAGLKRRGGSARTVSDKVASLELCEKTNSISQIKSDADAIINKAQQTGEKS